MSPVPREERAVTVPLNYALMASIVALLAVGLLAGTGGFVEDTQEQAVRSGLEVVGNRIATDVSTADRLAGTLDGSGSVESTTDLPEYVAGTTYQVTITGSQAADGDWEHDIVLTTTDPEVSVTVPVRTRRPISAGTFHGGRIVVSSDGTDLGVGRA